MNAITTYNRQGNAPAEFNSGLLSSFINWIDRSEKTTRTYINNLQQFFAWLKYVEVKNPLRQDIISYRQYLSAEHEAITLDPLRPEGWSYRTDRTGAPLRISCKPNTINQYLRSVRQFFQWTADNGLYPNIAANIHGPKVRHDHHKKDALTAGEVLTIEQSIIDRAQDKQAAAAAAGKDKAGRIQRSSEQGKRLYAIYLLAVNAGLRTIEISRLNIKDFEEKRGQAFIYIQGKGHSEADQKKPIAAEVAAAVKDYLQARTDKYNNASPLFVSTGNRSGGKRIATTTISTMIKKAMQEAGFNSERLTAHSLRHTAGTAVQELTGDLFTTQKYLRHSNPATTEIYLHTNTEQREAEVVKDLYKYYHAAAAI